MNPLLSDWSAPFGLPPFALIADSDFGPAFEEALRQSKLAVDAIAADPASPTFANTIGALERADKLLNRVAGVFFNLTAADANDDRDALEAEIAPRLAAHSAEVLMNPALFKRIETVRQGTEKLGREEARILDLYHRMFVRAGARLDDAGKARLKAIMERLASLGTQFSQNVLADEKGWTLALGAGDLAGLPTDLIAALEGAAKERGQDGQLLTLSRSVVVPFLQFSSRRDLRQKVFAAWTARGANANGHDNTSIVAETLNLRRERAGLLGYASFADWRLEPEMARTPAAVRDMLMTVWEPALKAAKADEAILERRMRNDGINGDLEPWDWRYYSEQRRREELSLDEAELKPYFPLDRMIEATFDCASRLFGLSFHPMQAELYHPDARLWDVRRGSAHVGLFIGDYFARSSKRSGAWCSTFRNQSRMDGEVRPIVVNVCNFAKAPDGQPSLLTWDDARTLFHEFGHALHALLSNVTWPLIAGTNVATDFVELPSQLFEHWLSEPEVLEKFARHAATGEPLPASVMKRLLDAENYDQGFQTVEYLASALVDLDFHTGTVTESPMERQSDILARLGMPRSIAMRHATPHFQHVFSGDGYSSAYYAYMWSEMMDADAFAAFKETGDAFDAATAGRLEKFILSAGGSDDEAELYRSFRGKLPGVDALLKQRGFA
jgi:peptidyl-dipeptidase Dcp